MKNSENGIGVGIAPSALKNATNAGEPDTRIFKPWMWAGERTAVLAVVIARGERESM